MAAEFSSIPGPFSAVVIGAGGGVGGAVLQRLAASDRVADILAVARRPVAVSGKVRFALADVTDERDVAAAASKAADEVRLVFIATGVLHDADSGLSPEKQLRDLDAGRLARLFAVNTIGPALAIKHFAPLLPRSGKSVIAALSAKVGSIEDNRLGGWYGYRASKAALNQIVKTAAIEIAVRRKEAVLLALHPGTVDTPLSKPFQTGVAPQKLFEPDFAAERLLAAIDTASPADSGALLSWDGTRLPY